MIKQDDGRLAVILNIDPNLSSQLVRGIYYISLTVWKEGLLVDTIFPRRDATFTVK